MMFNYLLTVMIMNRGLPTWFNCLHPYFSTQKIIYAHILKRLPCCGKCQVGGLYELNFYHVVFIRLPCGDNESTNHQIWQGSRSEDDLN